VQICRDGARFGSLLDVCIIPLQQTKGERHGEVERVEPGSLAFLLPVFLLGSSVNRRPSATTYLIACAVDSMSKVVRSIFWAQEVEKPRQRSRVSEYSSIYFQTSIKSARVGHRADPYWRSQGLRMYIVLSRVC
jgi:hypothetical protein